KTCYTTKLWLPEKSPVKHCNSTISCARTAAGSSQPASLRGATPTMPTTTASRDAATAPKPRRCTALSGRS
ncbi:hypothetical protein ACFSKU_02190, partial [Pontibacter silvestris]